MYVCPRPEDWQKSAKSKMSKNKVFKSWCAVPDIFALTLADCEKEDFAPICRILNSGHQIKVA